MSSAPKLARPAERGSAGCARLQVRGANGVSGWRPGVLPRVQGGANSRDGAATQRRALAEICGNSARRMPVRPCPPAPASRPGSLPGHPGAGRVGAVAAAARTCGGKIRRDFFILACLRLRLALSHRGSALVDAADGCVPSRARRTRLQSRSPSRPPFWPPSLTPPARRGGSRRGFRRSRRAADHPRARSGRSPPGPSHPRARA